jgi:hypothetical protein
MLRWLQPVLQFEERGFGTSAGVRSYCSKWRDLIAIGLPEIRFGKVTQQCPRALTHL